MKPSMLYVVTIICSQYIFLCCGSIPFPPLSLITRYFKVCNKNSAKKLALCRIVYGIDSMYVIALFFPFGTCSFCYLLTLFVYYNVVVSLCQVLVNRPKSNPFQTSLSINCIRCPAYYSVGNQYREISLRNPIYSFPCKNALILPAAHCCKRL